MECGRAYGSNGITFTQALGRVTIQGSRVPLAPQAVPDSFVTSLVPLPVLDLDSGMGLLAKLRSLGPRR